MCDLEKALGGGASGMDNTFWDAFSVKVGEFFYQLIVF
jgi:hypothetical protein